MEAVSKETASALFWKGLIFYVHYIVNSNLTSSAVITFDVDSRGFASRSKKMDITQNYGMLSRFWVSPHIDLIILKQQPFFSFSEILHYNQSRLYKDNNINKLYVRWSYLGQISSFRASLIKYSLF